MTDEGTEPSCHETGNMATSARNTGPGAELARQREIKGWSIEHVARQLNLAPRQIQALEADNHSALPGMASVRGFIRAYAKLLKIEVEPLLTLIQPHADSGIAEPVPMRPALSAPFSDSISFGSGRRLPWKNIILTAFVLAVTAGAYWGDRQGWFLPKETSGQVAEKKQQEPLPPAQDSSPGVPNMAAASDSAVIQASAAAPVPDKVVAEVPVASPVRAPAAIPMTMLAPAASGQGKLFVNFREQSWLEVHHLDKDGRQTELLAARLVPAGSKESFDLSQPVAVVIGNAHGVDMELRGKPIDLKTLGKSNVARLTLK